jgi:hypothetical protein
MDNNLDIIKKYFRDIKLSFLLDKYNIKVCDKKLDDKFSFLKKNNKIIKYANSIGAVLTGSRALSSYVIDGKSIIERKPNDWDFIITQEMAFDICNKFNIDYNLSDKVINIDSQLFKWYPGYSSVPNRLGVQDVQLIIDELPRYNKAEKYKIADISYIIDNKIKSIEKGKDKGKHKADLNRIIVKLNTNK